jgi:hypothetical protein
MKNVAEQLLEGGGSGRGPTPVNAEEQRRLSELMRSIDWFDAAQRKVIADTVVRKLTEEIRKEDITQFYSDTERFGVGETPQYTFQKGLKAYIHEPGTYAPRSTMIQRVVTVATELISVHPEMEVSQLQGGRFGGIANLKNQAKQELIGRKNAILWTTLVNSIASTDTNYAQWASTEGVTVKKNFLVSGLAYVDDRAPGGVRAIVGRRTSLDFINELGEVTDASEFLKERLDRSGGKLIGEFRGVPVIALHQYTDGYDVNRITEDNIMIVANDTTKLVVTEDLSQLEEINVDDRMWHVHISEKYGAVVFWPERNFLCVTNA